jgi:hypothetical protein
LYSKVSINKNKFLFKSKNYVNKFRSIRFSCVNKKKYKNFNLTNSFKNNNIINLYFKEESFLTWSF